MERFKRVPENEDEQTLLDRGWEMIGLHGWKHPAANNVYHTTEHAMEVDLSGYHPIAIEHEKMLELIRSIAVGKYHSNRAAACELLCEMGYD